MFGRYSLYLENDRGAFETDVSGPNLESSQT